MTKLLERGNSILLAAILLLAAAGFRTWQLDRVPLGPHHDEVINGQIVQEFIWPALPAWLRSASSSPFIPWLTIQANPRGPDLQEHAWLFQVTLAGTMSILGTNLLGVRFAAFAWGMLGVSACYALTRRLFGRDVALIAIAVQSVSFWSVSIGRVGLRVGTILPLLALAGCVFWDVWRSSRHPLARFSFAGALLGFSVYGYLSARPMVLAFIAFAVYLGLTRPPHLESKRLAWGMVVLLLSAALVAAPLFLYLQTHPDANLRFNMLNSPLQELEAGRPATVIQTGLATLGMFFWRGDPQPQYNVAGRPVFDPMGAVLFIGGLVVAIWRWRRPAHTFALLWLAVSLLPGMLSQPAPHWLRTVAAQAVTYGFVGLGAVCLGRFVWRARLVWAGPLFAAGVAVWFLGFAAWNFQGYFRLWPISYEVDILYQRAITEVARYLDRQADTTPVVACSISPYSEFDDFVRSPRQTFPFILRRTDLSIRWFNCQNALVIPAGGPARLIFPALHYTSTMDGGLQAWIASSVSVHDDQLPDGTVYTLDASRRFAAEVISATETSEVTWSPEAGVSGRASLPTDFGHAVEFLGYRVERAQRRVGKDVRVWTYWRVAKPPPMFMIGFMHLLSDPYHIVAQHDHQGALYDTLQPGDRFIQLYKFTIPPGTPPGAYRLSLGWYTAPSQRRLTVYDGATPRGDRLMLQEITVLP